MLAPGRGPCQDLMTNPAHLLDKLPSASFTQSFLPQMLSSFVQHSLPFNLLVLLRAPQDSKLRKQLLHHLALSHAAIQAFTTTLQCSEDRYQLWQGYMSVTGGFLFLTS